MQLKTMAAYHKNSKVFLLQTWLKHFLTSRQKMSMSMAVNVPISYQKHLMLLQQTQQKKIVTSCQILGDLLPQTCLKMFQHPIKYVGFW